MPATSQITNTSRQIRFNKETKEQILDSTQIENVDKGLRNEERQRIRIKQLEAALRSKDSIINKLEESNAEIVESLSKKLDEIREEGRRATAATEQLYETEKLKRKGGFFLGGTFVTDPINTVTGDLYWVRKTLIFGGGIGSIRLVDEPQVFYKVSIAIKIF